MTVNEEHMRQWTAALRSGKYEQGRGGLKNTDGQFCCLGVACDVYDPYGWRDDEIRGDLVTYRTGKSYDTTVLPDVVRNWLGVDDSLPQLPDGRSLVELNDSYTDRRTFAEIADAIEETYL